MVLAGALELSNRLAQTGGFVRCGSVDAAEINRVGCVGQNPAISRLTHLFSRMKSGNASWIASGSKQIRIMVPKHHYP